MDKVFKQNPSLKEYFKTSDGQKFYSQSDAKNHGKNLGNKEVETIVNSNISEVDFVGSEESVSVDMVIDLKKTDLGNTLDSPTPTLELVKTEPTDESADAPKVELVKTEPTDESSDAPKVEEAKSESTDESVEAPKVEEVKTEPTDESVKAPAKTKKKNSPSKTAK